MVTVVGIKGSIKANLYGLAKGLEKHGDKLELVDNINQVKDADAFIQTNLLKPKFELNDISRIPYHYIAESGKPFLVNESSSFRKHIQWKRLGWYSYKWTDGIFGNENSPPDRWNKFRKESGIQIKDWKSPGDNILIMGQKEGDSSLLNLYKEYDSFYDWVEFIINEIRKYSDRKIIVRPHPKNLSRGQKLANHLNKKKKLNIEVSKNVGDALGVQGGEGLDRDLNRAYCVVTYNSLSGIESICEGIPTFAFENGSMIWPIAHKDISKIENLNYETDITQWCHDIAYTQWTNKENKTGESWEHLKPLIFGVNK